MSPTEGVRTSDFWRTLFDFENKPGRYALLLRQPRVLFDNGRLLLQLCAGRVTSEMSEHQIPEERAKVAARFFVKTAMLRQGTDYFTLLGLKPGFAEAELKENYRLLMRMTHPDFANQADGWPEDSATRINRAYDILSSQDSRKNYELGLDMRAFGQSKDASDADKTTGSALKYVLITVLVAGLGVGLFKWWRSAPAPVASSAVPSEQAQSAASRALTPEQIVAESVRRSLAGVPVQALPPAPAPTAEPAPVVAESRNPASSSESMRIPSSPVGVIAPQPVPPVIGATARSLPTPALPPATTVPQTSPQVATASNRSLAGASADTRPAAAIPPLAATPAVKDSKPATAQSAVTKALIPPPLATVTATPANSAPRVEAVRKEISPAAPSPQASAKPASSDAVVPSQAAPKLNEVQPYLSGLISSMLSGREATVLAMIDKPVQGTDGANRFLRHYSEVVRGAEEVRMGSLQLKSYVEGPYLLVEGAVHFVLLDSNRTPIVRELRIRAYYGTQGGQTHLAALYPG